ncbi:MAG: hypothetical protein U1E53_12155 [Dongiaceae bacterium]
MINLPSTALAALLALAGAAFAQDSGQAPDAGGVDQPPADLYQGPIVGGKKIQPTQSEIMDRLMLQREGQPGGAPPPQQKDKELDELYDQLLQQSGPGSSTGQ